MTFQTTRWSLVLRAAQPGDAGRLALGELCAGYWQPVYVFYRRLGANSDDAADLTQGLFADLLARGDLATTAPERGRFRAWLRTCARNWWTNERERASAQKRGGGIATVPLDRGDAEAWFGREAAALDDADAVFERRWAQTVIERAVWRLEQDEIAAGRGELFAHLRPSLDGDGAAGSWAALAARLGTSEGALKVAAHRLRSRCRERVVAEVRETLADTGAPGEELRELLAALQQPAGRRFSGESR
jgi:DNA-directed RNA polymerase specialized sigma24 family protein